jgi:hypothetical protein
MDILWFLTVAPSWMEVATNNSLWNDLRGSHMFVIFLSFLSLVAKVLF